MLGGVFERQLTFHLRFQCTCDSTDLHENELWGVGYADKKLNEDSDNLVYDF